MSRPDGRRGAVRRRDRRCRRRSIGVSLAAIAMLAGCGGRDDGPLAPGNDEAIVGSGVLLDPGETFTDRSVVLFNPGIEPAELISIQRLGSTGRATKLREYVVLGTKTQEAVTGAGEGFPPRAYRRKDLKPVPGFRVPPSRSREGRLGAVVITAGNVAGGEYQLRYRIGDDEYETEFHSVIAVCAAKGESCDPDDLAERLMDEASDAWDR